MEKIFPGNTTIHLLDCMMNHKGEIGICINEQTQAILVLPKTHAKELVANLLTLINTPESDLR